MEEENKLNELFYKNQTPLFEYSKKNKFLDDEIYKFYKLGFTFETGKNEFEKIQIFPWQIFKAFKINIFNDKNKIALKFKEEFIPKYLNENNSKWILLNIKDKNKKYLILDLLNEKLEKTQEETDLVKPITILQTLITIAIGVLFYWLIDYFNL